jgi:DNA-binding transcriptional LysR family regulator
VAFDLVDLELFVGVVEAGSITHGCERAHLSLPSASARIAAMERALGAPLLDRGRRGVTPTATGQLLLRHGRALVSQVSRMRSELQDHVDGGASAVRVLANTAAVTTFLPPAIIDFIAAHPEVRVDLQERASHEAVDAVHDGHADLAIVADSVHLGTLHQNRLRTDRLILLVPPGDPLAERSSVTFASCLDRHFVGLGPGRALYDHLAGQSMPLGRRPTYRATLPTIDAVLRAVAAGVGIAILPEASLHGRAASPVARVDLAHAWATRTLVACHRADGALSDPARALIEHLATPED